MSEITIDTERTERDDPGATAILDAALVLLAERGVAGFTTDALASAARVSKSSIYGRWRSKDEIFVALVDHVAGPAEVDDLGDLEAEFRRWFADRQDVYSRPAFRHVVTSLLEVASHDEVMDLAMSRARTYEQSTIRQILTRARDRGEIDPGWDLEVLSHYLQGGIVFRVIFDGGALDDASVEQFRQLLMLTLGQVAPRQ